MLEELLLDNALEVLDKNGAKTAYSCLLSGMANIAAPSAQAYNFLYCLAAVCGKRDEALEWMRTAIVEKNMWYRPEVFDDNDLDSIRNSAEFTKYKEISDVRYYEAQAAAKTICTWEKVQNDAIALCLHGNQQNMADSQRDWQFLKESGLQIEYVQSKTLDSHAIFRWDADAETQLDGVIAAIDWDAYQGRALCGFSAGCNEILRTLAKGEIKCERVILVAPWIPMLENEADILFEALRNNDTKVMIYCGADDNDCLPYAERLHDEAVLAGINASIRVVEGLGHAFPADM